MRTAIVHDWLTGMRGGEKVLEVLCERYPHAEIFTLLHVRGSVSPGIAHLPIHSSALQYLPAVRHYYRECLPLFPALIEQFDLDRFDLVISSSHCVAKGALARPDAVHVCYCHTPMRYAWDQFDAYFGPERLGRPASAALRPALASLARWDRETAGRVQRYLTNSQYVAGRIRRYYNREATVVYPPVDTEFFQPDATHPATIGSYALVVSALVPYKRIDLAIAACRQARVPLTIVGTGPEDPRLHHLAAGSDVRFLGCVSNDEVRNLYRHAGVALLTGEEDFGIVPVEAQACGTPVVALGRGGAVETVVAGQTGLLVDEQRADAFADAIARAMQQPFDRACIRRHAERFSRARFGDQIEALVADTVAGASARGDAGPQAHQQAPSTASASDSHEPEPERMRRQERLGVGHQPPEKSGATRKRQQW